MERISFLSAGVKEAASTIGRLPGVTSISVDRGAAQYVIVIIQRLNQTLLLRYDVTRISVRLSAIRYVSGRSQAARAIPSTTCRKGPAVTCSAPSDPLAPGHHTQMVPRSAVARRQTTTDLSLIHI